MAAHRSFRDFRHPRTLPDIESMIRRLGTLFGAPERAEEIAAQMERRRLAIEAEVDEESIAVRVLSLIWKGPWMTTGPRTMQRSGKPGGLLRLVWV